MLQPIKAKFFFFQELIIIYLLPHPTLGGCAMQNHHIYIIDFKRLSPHMQKP
jgi:hypothetical protein